MKRYATTGAAFLLALMSHSTSRGAEGEWQRKLLSMRKPVDAATGDKRLTLGPWYVTAPIRCRGLNQKLFPEDRVDLEEKNSRGKRVWTQRKNYTDGRVHNLPVMDNCATYLFRTIDSGSKRTVRAGLGSDDGFTIWLNGRKLKSVNAARGAAPDQDRVALPMERGENKLLLKVHNGVGGHGFYFSMGGKGSGPAWEGDFPIEADWVSKDTGNFGDWFDSAGTDIEASMIRKVADELGAKGSSYLKKLERLQDNNTSKQDPAWLDLYVDACRARRTRRLAALTHKTSKVVFTKHYDMGGSHYAYTEGLSDAQRERHFRPGTALCMLHIDGSKTRVETLIDDPKGVIRDPDVSYDGKRILFSWKKSDREDDYHLYEMDVETKKTRQLTFGLGFADYEGVYLPDDNIVFNSTRCIETVDCWWTEVSNLYICDKDGKYMRRVGFDQVHTNYPQVLEDGRVVYTRWDYNDRGQLYPQPLFQMNIDGTGQTEFYGNNSWFPTTIMHARGIPGSHKLVAIMSGHHTHQNGKLGIIDTTRGRQEASGIQLIAPITDTKAVRVDRYGQGGDQWQYPYALNEREYIVTFKPQGKRVYAIYYMDIDGNRELLARDDAVSCNQPVLVMPRPKPLIRPSLVDYRKQTGSYFLQDIYFGPGLKGVERGTIKKLRVVALEFRAAGVGANGNGGPAGGALVSTPIAIRNGTWDVKHVLGDAKVYEDGSAFFEVPARTPVYFQALDKNNHVVQSMRTWSTLMPGENFACIGCHEDKDATPPAGLNTTRAMMMGLQKLEPFYGPARGFSYIKEVQPILDKHCVRCHNDRSKKVASSRRGRPRPPAASLSNMKPLLARNSRWKYTSRDPGSEWYKESFADDDWTEAQAGFGTRGTPGGSINSNWNTRQIWMRTSFESPGEFPKKLLSLQVCHDEDVEIYINGIKAASARGYITRYADLGISEEAARAIRCGRNVIAVTCKQTTGGQYIDVALYGPKTPPATGAAGPGIAKPVDESPSKAKKAFSLLGETGAKGGGRNWSDSYLRLTMNGRPNPIVNWLNVQSIPPMLPPYFAGAAKSKLPKMLAEGHNKVRLSREELDKIACWIDLLVPYCGDYMEANNWNQDGLNQYTKFLRKRWHMEDIEIANIEAYVKKTTGEDYSMPRPKRPSLRGNTPEPVNSTGYRNIALNPNDVAGPAYSHPHASTNSEYNKTAFAAKNVIDGNKKNKGHGGGYPSWGPHKRDDLWLKIDLGKPYEIDKVVMWVRADFKPYRRNDHDSWFKTGTIEFSDGSRHSFTLDKTAEGQEIRFDKRTASWVKFTNLVPNEDKWCGFSEVEVWGK